MARISEYNTKIHCSVAKRLAGKGFIDSEIAEIMGISERTLNNWKEKHPEFMQSLKDGKEEPDQAVERSLFERATGYVNKNAVKIFMPANAEEPVYAPYEEHVAPDVTAQIFWLKNRRPDRWRDRQEVEHSGTVQIIDDIPKIKP